MEKNTCCKGCVLIVLGWGLLTGQAAVARDCDVAADAINDAADLLIKVGQQTALEDGRRIARQLQRHLDDAAVESSECDCEQAASKLDAAGAKLRRARSMDSRRDFAEQVNRVIDDFNVGVAHMEICIVN